MKGFYTTLNNYLPKRNPEPNQVPIWHDLAKQGAMVDVENVDLEVYLYQVGQVQDHMPFQEHRLYCPAGWRRHLSLYQEAFEKGIGLV
jgi:hypothetical protein